MIRIDNKLKHIVFYSGGIGSWMSTKRVIDQYGKDNVILLFTDTYIEDEDLYRFIIETSNKLFDIKNNPLTSKIKDIPSIRVEGERIEYLNELAKMVHKNNPNFFWISDGRTPFQVYKDVKFLGNSRIAPCSHKLKQDVADRWIRENFSHDECVLYLGIDWTEEHRTKAPVNNWKPYRVEFPMCEEPYITKDEMLQELENVGIKIPRLYKMDFSHNNCGGFCCRAGQGHFANLLEKIPERFAEYEQREQEMIKYLNKDIAILKKTRNKVTKPYTLKELRLDIEAKNTKDIDMTDIGGCGCFVDDDLRDED